MPDDSATQPSAGDLSIVAVAASAGGLEATSLLVQNLPVDLNCCYVIAQHMSPSHKSMVVPLLGRETKLTVEELQPDTEPRPNVIYIPPPAHDVTFSDGRLTLRTPSAHPATPKPSADRLFKTLAEGLGERAIGVVLSGTGSDGSYGVQAIREHGGITIAQEPASCKYDGMPTAAVESGCVDLTLTPQQIGEHIAVILARPRDLAALKELNETVNRNRDLFEILLSQTLVDFRNYKESTVNRRIQRRMVAKGIETIEAYVDLCRRSHEEVQALYRDLLISVTRFFRDPAQFRALAEVLDHRYRGRERTSAIRMWIPGCATGEEAYSIAILVAEAMGGLSEMAPDDLQIFATDIDEDALNVGRKGVYPIAAAADIPNHLLNRYFDVSGDKITVKARLRGFVMFSRHNVFQDAPFISVDLVSVRNVLIYFNSKLQERVLTRIIYALNAGGLLFLGTSESLGHMDTSFTPASDKARIFRKREHRWRSLPDDAHMQHPGPIYDPRAERRRPPRPEVDDWRYFDLLARSVVKDGLLINRDQSVLRIYGDLAPYAAVTSKSFGQNSLAILRRPLAADAASLALVALKTMETRSGQWHEMPDQSGTMCRITVFPMPKSEDTEEDLVLVGIESRDRQNPQPQPDDESDSTYVTFLEDELGRTRDALQGTVEQLQTSNEELQSVNEELQSSNEELQSTNEELETSNEELQSTNEELITVNEELLVNSGQLERVTAELGGLIAHSPTTLLMLDQGLIIRHASARAREVFKIRERGTGFGHLSQCEVPSGYPKLIEICSQVLLERRPWREQFVTGIALNELHVAPITSAEQTLIGLLLQVESVESELLSNKLEKHLRDMSQIGTWRINLTKGKTSNSANAFNLMGKSESSTISSLKETVAALHPDDRDRIEARLKRAAERNERFEYLARMRQNGHGYIVVEVNGEAYDDPDTGDKMIVGVIRNNTREQTNNLLVAYYNRIAEERGIGFYTYDVANDLPYWSPVLYRLLGIDPATPATVSAALDRFTPESRARIEAALLRAIETAEPYDYVETMIAAEGREVKVHGTGDVALAEDGTVTHVYGSFEIVDEP